MNLANFDNRDFDRGASRIKEAFWVLTKCLFFLPPFPLPSSWRVGLLRMFGTKVGKGVVIRSQVNVTFPWKLSIGDHVWIGEEALILSLAEVKIGSNVCISQRAFLCTGSHDHRAENFDLITKPITLEDETWVGAQAFVGPGVTIGSGSVIAAGAVVVRDVESGAVVAGNPARSVNSEQ